MTDNEIKRSMISAREEYINIIKSELLGPGSEFSLPDAERTAIYQKWKLIMEHLPFIQKKK